MLCTNSNAEVASTWVWRGRWLDQSQTRRNKVVAHQQKIELVSHSASPGHGPIPSAAARVLADVGDIAAIPVHFSAGILDRTGGLDLALVGPGHSGSAAGVLIIDLRPGAVLFDMQTEDDRLPLRRPATLTAASRRGESPGTDIVHDTTDPCPPRGTPGICLHVVDRLGTLDVDLVKGESLVRFHLVRSTPIRSTRYSGSGASASEAPCHSGGRLWAQDLAKGSCQGCAWTSMSPTAMFGSAAAS